MKFEISQALLIERTIVVSATILLFGLVSIGGLWLWRRHAERHERPNSKVPAE